MNDVGLVETLREIDFLHGIGDEHLERIASVAQLLEIPEGKVIFREGDPAEYIYLITRGDVSLEICAPGIGCRRIHTVCQGELLGWSPVLEQPQLTVTARTLAPTQAVKVSGSQILALSEHNPRFGYEFMRRVSRALGKRLDSARMRLLEAYGPEMPTAVEE